MWACNASEMLDFYYDWMGIIDKTTEYFMLFNALATVFVTSFYASAARTYSNIEYQSMIAANSSFSNIDDIAAVNMGITDTVKFTQQRRTWRQSELLGATTYPTSKGYLYNQSYTLVNGKLTKVPYGTKGSVRPDYYSEQLKHCVDIKKLYYYYLVREKFTCT